MAVQRPAKARSDLIPRGWRAGLPTLVALAAALLPVALSPDAASAPAAISTTPDGLDRAIEARRACRIEAPLLHTTPRRERVLLGLAAWACEEAGRAVAALRLESDPEAAYEDWRLFALADAAALEGLHALAAEAAERLLLDHPGSPLRHRAYALRTRVALSAGDAERALRMARRARSAPFPPDLRIELDILAWEAASELGRTIDIRQEARTLLLRSPIDAADLRVSDSLRNADGEIDWAEQLEPWELRRRAERLIESKLLDEAFTALDALGEEERDLHWHLLRAEALIEDRRGAEALALLAALEAGDRRDDLDLAWWRSAAALDAGTARRGRNNLPSAARADMRRLAREQLAHVARVGGDGERAREALQLLFEELADGEHFEEVREVLRRLRALDPDDRTGVKYLWRLGWKHFDARNYTGAIGYWSELRTLYPGTKEDRAGLYWSGRSHQALGDTTRSRQIFEEVAGVAATDYYRKHALLQLGRDAEPRVPIPRAALREWPRDPALARAEELSDLGLDRLGLEELELVGADRTAVDALRSRILARRGQRRDSIQNLWRVFPMLGTHEQVSVPTDALEMYYPTDFRDIVERFAAANDLPVSLLMAMIRQESAFDISARSWAGARGLMQVMPATARELARALGLPYSRDRLDEPAYSVQLGSRYFRQVLDMFDGDIELALAGYNAGPYRIRKLVQRAGSRREPDVFLEGLKIEESKTYVKRVVLFSNSYRQLYPDLG